MREEFEGMGGEAMMIIGTAWLRRRNDSPKINRRRAPLCGYLGCGQYATRNAWDRHYNMIYACSDPGHGRSVAS